MGSKNETTQSLDREQQAFTLSCAGMTYEEIAEQLGYASKSSAWDAVQRVLRKRAAETEGLRDEVIQKHREIIRLCVRGQMPKIMKGDSRAVEVVIKALEREAKMLGVDAPVKADVKITDALQSEIDALVEAMASMDEIERSNLLARERG